MFTAGAGQEKVKMFMTNSDVFSLIEHGPMDYETVVPGAAADDQAEHKQCMLLMLLQKMH